ncbi:Cna B-type domain-containing protein, partial [Peptoniphilus asaccharolyticus]
VSYDGSMKDGFKIANQEEQSWTPMIPPTRDVKVTKDWKNSKGESLKAPVDKIEVELYKDGVATGKKLELNAGNNWSGEFKKLEVADKLRSTNYYQYTVKEVGESGNSIKLDGKWFNVSYDGSMKDGFKIINKYKEPEKPTEPKEPEKPKRNTPNKNLPKTGDTQDPFLYSIILGISGLFLILLGNWKRKNERKERS